jgi:hypothetical protein
MQSSNGEVLIHQILELADIPFEEEYIFDDLVAESGKHLRFDFAIFNDDGDLDCLIEYQGKQHYIASKKFGGAKGLHRQQHNDQKKREYCLNHGIRLIAIPYIEEPKLSYDYLIKLIYGY